MAEVAITLRCKMCHLLCSKEEAERRVFHTGKCGSCGGELELFSAETMPDPPAPKPMNAYGDVIIDRFDEPPHIEEPPSEVPPTPDPEPEGLEETSSKLPASSRPKRRKSNG